MRRITLTIVSTVAALVLLFSYRTSTGGAVRAATPAAVPGVVPGSASPPAASGTRVPKTVTVNGSVAHTRWGPVQVQVRIVDGRITDVRTVLHPSGNSQDEQINGYALPRLRAEVLAAQSARIDTISGATVTSDGYLSSLQSALDAASFR